MLFFLPSVANPTFSNYTVTQRLHWLQYLHYIVAIILDYWKQNNLIILIHKYKIKLVHSITENNNYTIHLLNILHKFNNHAFPSSLSRSWQLHIHFQPWRWRSGRPQRNIQAWRAGRWEGKRAWRWLRKWDAWWCCCNCSRHWLQTLYLKQTKISY